MTQPSLSITISCPAGKVNATIISLYDRADVGEATAAPTVRNMVRAFFDASALIDRVAFVVTDGGTPLLLGETCGHQWFDVSAAPVQVAVRKP